VQWLGEQWGGPFMVKGVTWVDDAKRAADVGVTAISVSNHGGNGLDGTPATIRVLPGIVAAVGDQLEIVLDGGIRRGGDVDQATGGGTPSTLADNAGSQPQTAHACRTDDRPNSRAERCGSGLARASSQSSTYSPSPVSQRAAAGDSVAAANPAGAGYA
jgi:hypothetical protein